ncbi:MAG: hypothetical protein GQ529_02150 [Methyloprofundus sp.]|nr:hypothetical protein [Methyloprofundus sp.]
MAKFSVGKQSHQLIVLPPLFGWLLLDYLIRRAHYERATEMGFELIATDIAKLEISKA